jgi:hypothetical protein
MTAITPALTPPERPFKMKQNLFALGILFLLTPAAHAYDETNSKSMADIPAGSVFQIKTAIVIKGCQQSTVEMEGGENSCYDSAAVEQKWVNLDIGQHCLLYGSHGKSLDFIPAGNCSVAIPPTKKGNQTTISFSGCAIESMMCQRSYVIPSDTPLTIGELRKNLGDSFGVEIADPAHPDSATMNTSETKSAIDDAKLGGGDGDDNSAKPVKKGN